MHILFSDVAREGTGGTSPPVIIIIDFEFFFRSEVKWERGR